MPLRQIRAMILAVTELAHAFGRHVGRRRGGVDAHATSLPGVDTQHGLMQGLCTRDPACRDAQRFESRRQPIIGQVAWFDLAAEASPEGAPMGFDPRLNVREPVVALGEDEGQPRDRRPAETSSRPMAMGREVVAQ